MSKSVTSQTEKNQVFDRSELIKNKAPTINKHQMVRTSFVCVGNLKILAQINSLY